MNDNDPIKIAEEVVRATDREAGRYAKPVLKRYPFLFSFLTIFSAAAIMYGFELWAGSVRTFREHPSILLILGIVGLIITGSLYKFLKQRM